MMKRFLSLLALLLMVPMFVTAQQAGENADSIIAPPDTLRTVLLVQDTAVAATDTAIADKKTLDRLTELPYAFLNTSNFIWAILVLVVTYFVIRLLERLLSMIAEKSARHRITIKGLIPLVRILGWCGALLFVIMGIFQPSFATLIAFSASIGVAVGFASQDILKNIFGGIVIIFDQPFKVGDKIEIGSYYGEVVEIGLRSTRLVTPDDSLVTVPNGELMNQSVSNANAGEPNCQVVAEFFLPIDIDTERVRHIAIQAAQVSRFVYLNKPVVVLFFQEIKERKSFLKMRLKAYVLDIRFEFAFKSDMTERVLRALLDEGILSGDEGR